MALPDGAAAQTVPSSETLNGPFQRQARPAHTSSGAEHGRDRSCVPRKADIAGLVGRTGAVGWSIVRRGCQIWGRRAPPCCLAVYRVSRVSARSVYPRRLRVFPVYWSRFLTDAILINDCHRRDAGATAPLALVYTPLLYVNSLSKQRKTDRQQCAALTASYELLLRRIGLE